jgi:hypothetical protein
MGKMDFAFRALQNPMGHRTFSASPLVGCVIVEREYEGRRVLCWVAACEYFVCCEYLLKTTGTGLLKRSDNNKQPVLVFVGVPGAMAILPLTT